MNTLLITFLKSKKKTGNNEIELKILEIDNILYSNTHLLPSRLFGVWKEIETVTDGFLQSSDPINNELIEEYYDKFNEKYYNIIKLIVKNLGINKLSSENKALFDSML